MVPTKKSGKKKGHSAISEVVTRKYIINVHKHIHRVGFKKRAPQVLEEFRKLAVQAMGTSGVHTDTRLSKAAWATGTRNVSHHMRVSATAQKT